MKRFPKQNIILHDQNRNLAFLYNCQNKDDYEIVQVPNHFKVNSFSKEELQFQKLWKTFFETIAIKERTTYSKTFSPPGTWRSVPPRWPFATKCSTPCWRVASPCATPGRGLARPTPIWRRGRCTTASAPPAGSPSGLF